jgi:hypothetical protein
MNTEKIYKYHYLYKITNLINNKYYIGIHSTNDFLNNGWELGMKPKNDKKS